MLYARGMDTFTCFVAHTSGEGRFLEPAAISRVVVEAARTNEATLAALEIVASRGRCPVAVEVDWVNF